MLLIANQLTAWTKVLDFKFSASTRTCSFITEFTKPLHVSLPLMKSVNSPQSTTQLSKTYLILIAPIF